MIETFPRLNCRSKVVFHCDTKSIQGCQQQAAWASAFTRIELLALFASLALLALIALPVLASTSPRSQRFVCANNLRQIGQALHLWAGDHGDRIPPMVPTSEGGTQLMLSGVNSWVQFSWISNELGTAKILACPSDDGKVARDFSSNPASGLLYPTFRNNAVSYFLTHPAPDFPRDILSGDRNLAVYLQNIGCSFFARAAAVSLPPFSKGGWTDSIHINAGNLLGADGHVEILSNAGLSSYLSRPVDDNSSIHLLIPR